MRFLPSASATASRCTSHGSGPALVVNWQYATAIRLPSGDHAGFGKPCTLSSNSLRLPVVASTDHSVSYPLSSSPPPSFDRARRYRRIAFSSAGSGFDVPSESIRCSVSSSPFRNDCVRNRLPSAVQSMTQWS